MRAVILFILASLACDPAAALAQTPELDAAADRAIVQISGDLYSFRSGRQHSVFLVTRDGIVVVDPLGLYAASWLSAQLQQRFPNTRVRYVVLTHHHVERAGGAGVLKPDTVIGHENFRSELSQTSNRSSADYRYVVSPRVTFEERHTFEVGGKSIDLVHTGPFHARDMIAVSFRQERFTFVADPPDIARVPFAIGSARAADVVQWLRAVVSTGCETVMFSDGSTMKCEALAGLSQYLNAMRAAVLTAYERGDSVQKTIATLPLDAYRALSHYAGRAQQIADMYRQITFRRIDITLSGVAQYLPERDPDFCAGYEQCHGGGALPAGTAAVAIAMGRRVGVQAEAMVGDQFWSSRTRPLYQEETVLRPFVLSGLLRFNVTRSRNLTVIAGVSHVTGDVRGLDRVEGRFIPAGGRHAIHETSRRTGVTAGIELSQRIGPLRFVVPLRVTQALGDRPHFWPSRLSGSAGLGISFPIVRVLE
jgi:hypothetical protein